MTTTIFQRVYKLKICCLLYSEDLCRDHDELASDALWKDDDDARRRLGLAHVDAALVLSVRYSRVCAAGRLELDDEAVLDDEICAHSAHLALAEVDRDDALRLEVDVQIMKTDLKRTVIDGLQVACTQRVEDFVCKVADELDVCTLLFDGNWRLRCRCRRRSVGCSLVGRTRLLVVAGLLARAALTGRRHGDL